MTHDPMRQADDSRLADPPHSAQAEERDRAAAQCQGGYWRAHSIGSAPLVMIGTS
jgi:hypothetical protein